MKKHFFFTRWTFLTHFGTHLFGLCLAACRSPLGLGTGVWVLVRAILRGGNHQKWLVAGGLGALEIAVLEPGSPRYGLFLVWGCRRPMCNKFWGFWGPFGGDSRTYCGVRGPFGTGKSSCMCRGATISLHLAVFSSVWGSFGQKKADFDPKLQILKWRSDTCDACSRPPPLSFWLILCVVIAQTHR